MKNKLIICGCLTGVISLNAVAVATQPIHQIFYAKNMRVHELNYGTKTHKLETPPNITQITQTESPASLNFPETEVEVKNVYYNFAVPLNAHNVKVSQPSDGKGTFTLQIALDSLPIDNSSACENTEFAEVVMPAAQSSSEATRHSLLYQEINKIIKRGWGMFPVVLEVTPESNVNVGVITDEDEKNKENEPILNSQIAPSKLILTKAKDEHKDTLKMQLTKKCSLRFRVTEDEKYVEYAGPIDKQFAYDNRIDLVKISDRHYRMN